MSEIKNSVRINISAANRWESCISRQVSEDIASLEITSAAIKNKKRETHVVSDVKCFLSVSPCMAMELTDSCNSTGYPITAVYSTEPVWLSIHQTDAPCLPLPQTVSSEASDSRITPS